VHLVGLLYEFIMMHGHLKVKELITQPNQYWYHDITISSDRNTLQSVLIQRHHNQYWHKHITMSTVITLQSVAIMFKNEKDAS